MSNVVHLFKKEHIRTCETFEAGRMYPLNPQEIIKQSAKAICLVGHISSTREPEKWSYSLDCWIPKSQLMGVFIPGWLLAAKAKTARESLCDLDRFIEEADSGYILMKDFYIRIAGIEINLDDACTQ